MMRATALALFYAFSAQPPGRPTHAALRKVFENNRATVVGVVGPKRSGSGVLVAANGYVATSVELVGLDQAKVRLGEVELPAKVLAADARLKLALLRIDLARGADVAMAATRAAAVRMESRFTRGEWLVGISRSDRGQLSPVLGQVVRAPGEGRPFLETDLPVRPGTPLFDDKGRLVAIAVQRRGKWGSRALPSLAVKALADSAGEGR